MLDLESNDAGHQMQRLVVAVGPGGIAAHWLKSLGSTALTTAWSLVNVARGSIESAKALGVLNSASRSSS